MSDPRQTGAVVAGPAGAGKTRLAREFQRQASALGCRVARVAGTAAQRAIPLAALAHLLPAPPLTSPGPPASAAAAHQGLGELLRQARAGLLAQEPGRRLVVVADDAHLLDEASVTLLYELMTAGQAFVLCTMRAAEPGPEVLVTAWKDELVTRIDLAGLTRLDLGHLLTAALGQVAPDAIEVLVGHAGCDALVLRELVLGAIADGTLACADGLWRLRPPLTPSPRLIELIEARLRGLDAADRAVAEIIAVGEPLSLAELSRVAESGRAERLERAGIIVCDQAGGPIRVRLAHPVYADVLRARLPVLRLQSIAAMLAEMTGHGARDVGELLRIGRLLLLSDAGSTGEDSDRDTLLAAARAARWGYAIPFAQQLVDASLAHRADASAEPPPAEPPGSGLFEAQLLAAELTGLQGHWQEADERLTRLAASAADGARRARVAIAAMDNWLYAGLPGKQREAADQASAALSDPHWREEIRARVSPALVMQAGPSVTWAAVRELTGRRGPTLVWAALTGAHALGRMGRTAAALELSQRGHAAHLELVQPLAWYPWYHLFNRCEILLQSGLLAEAEKLARDQHQAMIADHCAEGQASFAAQLALVLTARGQAETAALFAREAYVTFRDLGRPMFMRQAAERLAAALALAGHVRAAEKALTAASAGVDPAYLYNAVDLLHTSAWVAFAAGHADRARAELAEMGRLAREVGDLAGLSAALHSTARLNDGRRSAPVLEQLTGLAARMDGGLFPARLAHVRGLVSRDPRVLEEAATAFAEIGASILAAEAAADAAAAWQAHGDPRRGAAASRLARGYLSECQCATTLALRSISGRSVLTPAEREAAELAARGYSNKAIAAELVLSVRSIENRLQHVYEKLAISSRAELADALRFERA